MLSATRAAYFKQLNFFLRELRLAIKDQMTVQELQALLLVFSEPGISQRQIEDRALQRTTTVSKNVADFGHLTSKKSPGPGLVEATQDPMNLRLRLVRPTPHGIEVMGEIVSKVFGDASPVAKGQRSST